jgi:hypothetical protein
MADELRIEYLALSDLLRTARNPKKHDLPSLRASMLRWGFTQPLAIDERTGKLVEGHGRIEVLQEMQKAGGKPPLRVTAKGKEWFAPVVRGLSFANDQEAEAYLIAANQLTTAGGWDDRLLGSMLAQLQGAHVSFEGLGFDQGTITTMLASFAPAAEQLATMPVPVAPTFTPAAPAPTASNATAAPAASADAPPAMTPAAVQTSDGQFSPPPNSNATACRRTESGRCRCARPDHTDRERARTQGHAHDLDWPPPHSVLSGGKYEAGHPDYQVDGSHRQPVRVLHRPSVRAGRRQLRSKPLCSTRITPSPCSSLRRTTRAGSMRRHS